MFFFLDISKYDGDCWTNIIPFQGLLFKLNLTQLKINLTKFNGESSSMERPPLGETSLWRE